MLHALYKSVEKVTMTSVLTGGRLSAMSSLAGAYWWCNCDVGLYFLPT